jgi:hypothetical protein
MAGKLAAGTLGAVLAAGAMCGSGRPALAQTLVQHSAEARMQLDFHVPDAALKAMLPDGWDPVVATTGAAKDANIRMIFIDQLDVTGPDGAPVATSQMVYLAVPIKQGATNTTGQMIVFGLTADPKEAPGPFAVYQAAATHHMQRSTTADAQIQTEENWEFTAASGEHMELHLKYERGAARQASSETKFFSAANPSTYQIFKVEQGLDIMRNATITVPDKVKEFQYKASGGKIAKLFDGTERVLSIDHLPWYTRAIYQP